MDLPPEIWNAFFRYLNNAQRLTLLIACPDRASSFLAVGLEGVLFRPMGGVHRQPMANEDPLMFLEDNQDHMNVFGHRPLIHNEDVTFFINWPTRNHRDVMREGDSEEVVRTRTPFNGLSLLKQGKHMVYETSLTIKERFRFEPIFGQKKHQDFWAQATVPCPNGLNLMVQKAESGFVCVPTNVDTLKQNLTIVHDFGHLTLACVHVHGISAETPEFNKHKTEVDAFFDALRADVRYFEIFMDYVDAERKEVLQSYGPCHMECAENMPALSILKEMFRTLVRHKVDSRQYLQNHFLNMALGGELKALAQKFPSTAIQSKDARKVQPAETTKK